MARIRTIKPEFFTDEDLGDLPPLVRLFFAGLWCQADKAGRLKWKPRELKAKIMPFDRQYTPDRCLILLQQKHCVDTYETGGVTYVAIRNWDKHQKPHHTERDTTFPPPPDNRYPTVKERTEGKGKEGKGKEGKEGPPKLPPAAFTLDDVAYPDGMDTPEVRKALEDWLTYKRKRGESYKDPANQLTLLLDDDDFGHDPDVFAKGVKRSMARNWAGCFPAKGTNARTNQPDPDRPDGRVR